MCHGIETARNNALLLFMDGKYLLANLLAALLKGFSFCSWKVPEGGPMARGRCNNGALSSSVSLSESLGGASPLANTWGNKLHI